VISEVYGGGGNSGAPYSSDFIELFNRGSAPVPLGGRSLQYASATGTGNLGASATQLTELPDVSLEAGQRFLVQEAGGATGAPPPSPGFTDPTPINMSATAGKVALAEGTRSLGCNTAATCIANGATARVVDLVGYGNASYFEGTGPAPSASNTSSVARRGDGTDTDDNAADFSAGAPTPAGGSSGPAVASSDPADGATDVSTDTNVSITFSEDVGASSSDFAIDCTRSGSVALTVSGGPRTYVLDPTPELARGERCTVTVGPARNATVRFTTIGLALRIHEIQGAAHRSPFEGEVVSGVPGVVTARGANGFYLQDPEADGDPRTSEAVLVFTGSAPPAAAAVGSAVRVSGEVQEFRPGGASTANLTTTEIGGASVTPAGPGSPIAETVIGRGGRVPPSERIEDDAMGDVESDIAAFDPAQDGIDFYESLEAMLVQVNDAVAVGPTTDFGEIFTVADRGAGAGVRTPRGGVIVRPQDFNPERLQFDDVLAPERSPQVNVGDRFPGAVRAVVSYDFGNFELLNLDALKPVDAGLQRETTARPDARQLAAASFNVENPDPADPPEKFQRLAETLVNNLRSPDLVSIEEVQDNNGPVDDTTTDATLTYRELIEAIRVAGGPDYEFRQIDPVDGQDGGEPGGNIRVGFLFRTDRGLSFVDRPGGTPTSSTTVVKAGHGARLSASPGRIEPTDPAFNSSRKPLVGEFRFRGRSVFAIANHFNSKGGDQPLFGRFQPPTRSSEAQRHQQAAIVNGFVDHVLAADKQANVIVLGDLNDFEFSETLRILKGRELVNLVETLPPRERYSYVFEGNSQALDHILVSSALMRPWPEYDSVHVNAEFADQTSDHDPQVARLRIPGAHAP
jgi:predicted extracellular nuclease